MGNWILADDSSFAAQVLDSAEPVLVVFGADWSGPSRQVEDLLDQLRDRWDAPARYGKVNVDESVVTAQQYQIAVLPTVVLFQHGAACQRISGKQPVTQILEKFMPFFAQ